MQIDGFQSAQITVKKQSMRDCVILAGEIFAARRNSRELQVGDSVIVQTAKSGQIEAMVMAAPIDGIVAVRLSRWGATVTVDQAKILCRVAS